MADASLASSSIKSLLVKDEPNVGSEAPMTEIEHQSDLNEATDDVEFPEAVILIGKTHWRCVTCAELYSKFTSIDGHIHDNHAQQVQAQQGMRGRGRTRTHFRSVGRMTQIATRPQRSIPVRQPVQGISALRGRPASRRSRGRGMRGSRRSRGRGRILSRRLQDMSESDTETLVMPVQQKISPRKRKTRSSGVIYTNSPSPPPAKTLRTKEIAASPPYEDSVASPPQEKNITLKDKYLVVLSKAGNTVLDSEISLMEADPLPPIEIPSLQADALLPPATPLIPEIQGPPETPLPREIPNLSDELHPSETLCAPDTSGISHMFLPPETPQAVFLSHETLTIPATSVVLETPPSPVPVVLSKVSEHADVVLPPSSANSIISYDAREAIKSFSHVESPVEEKPVDYPVTCKTCNNHFSSPSEWKYHQIDSARFDVVLCSECGDKFHGVFQLNLHVFSVHEKFAKKFCFHCGADGLDIFELEEHLLEHSLEEPEKDKDIEDLESISHLCRVCSLEIEGNVSDLMNHYHTMHDRFICTLCFECFADTMAYQDHKLTHITDSNLGSELVVLTCPVSGCFQMCEDKDMLRDHISWHEDQDLDMDQPMLPCHDCDCEFRNKAALLRHLADVHNDNLVKPFLCELCNGEFSHSIELYHHCTLSHQEIKWYDCAYCSHRFALRSSYRRHVATEHDVPAAVLRM